MWGQGIGLFSSSLFLLSYFFDSLSSMLQISSREVFDEFSEPSFGLVEIDGSIEIRGLVEMYCGHFNDFYWKYIKASLIFGSGLVGEIQTGLLKHFGLLAEIRFIWGHSKLLLNQSMSSINNSILEYWSLGVFTDVLVYFYEDLRLVLIE